jgi:hypothetical protein
VEQKRVFYAMKANSLILRSVYNHQIRFSENHRAGIHYVMGFVPQRSKTKNGAVCLKKYNVVSILGRYSAGELNVETTPSATI